MPGITWLDGAKYDVTCCVTSVVSSLIQVSERQKAGLLSRCLSPPAMLADSFHVTWVDSSQIDRHERPNGLQRRRIAAANGAVV